MIRSRQRAAIAFVVAALATIAIVVGRTVWHAHVEVEAADTALRHDEPRRAIEHYRRALRWSFPFSPYEQRATEALTSVAQAAEKSGDRATSLLAWRSLVGGLSSSRSLYASSNPARDRARDEIAALLALERGPPIDAGSSRARRQATYRQLLAREVSPHPVWATLLLLGFFTWVGSLVFLSHEGFDSAGRFSWRQARSALMTAALGLVSFLVGLVFA